MIDDNPNPTTNITNGSGSADLNAGRDIIVGGDAVGRDKITNIEQTNSSGGAVIKGDVVIESHGEFVGRDKIIHNIQNIDQRARTAAEEAEQARLFEAQHLAQGVSAFAQPLRVRVGESTDAGTGGP